MPLLAAFALSAFIATPSAPIRIDGGLVHPHRMWVRAAANADLSGYAVIARYPQIGWAVVETPNLVSSQGLVRLAARRGVEEAAYDRAAVPAYTPNDPGWSQQWHLRTINADLAWDQSLGSPAATVAIMDTGVDVTHPDLQGNIWTNLGEIPGNGIDDEGDGYVDDVNGYDFAYNDPDPNDVNSHGTGCSGIAAARGDNNLQYSGVAPRAKVMALKAALDSGYFYDSANVPAYLYAADHGARALSMSFYSDRVSLAEEDALKYALKKGTLPVAAAGNDATVLPYYPAGYECVLSVAAINQDLTKAGFSDFGSWVDVAAPGTGLVTLAPGGGTMGFGGTSGACPHVAGAAALLAGAVPKASPSKIRYALEDTAKPLVEGTFGEYTNYGLIDVNRALAQLKKGVAAPARPTVVRWASPVGTGSGSTVTRIYGRSLHVGSLTLRGEGGDLTVRRRTRDYAEARLSKTDNAFRILRENDTLVRIASPEPKGLVYPFIEGVGRGGSVSTGGYFDTLLRDDKSLDVKSAGGKIEMQGTFRMVPSNAGTRTLVLRRAYSAVSKGTEHIKLYDWSSASYPYGNWIEIGTFGKPGRDATEIAIPVSKLKQFADFDGTVYFSVYTDGMPDGSRLIIDTLYLK